MRTITYIAVPLRQGAEKRGTELAPQSLWEGAKEIIRRYAQVEQVALPLPEIRTEAPAKYADMAQYMRQLKQTVQACMDDSLPFTVGGDHALGLGTVAAAAARYEDLGVIWFDAHGDMNTEATSHTGHIHGMPLAAAMGLCASELNEVADRHIQPEHIFWVGTRSLDEGEQALAKQLNLHVYSAQTVREQGMPYVMEQIQAELQRLHIRHLHVSIDIDAMDPQIVPATGVPETQGLNNTEYEQFVDRLLWLPAQLSSMDFVEYNPLLDDEAQHTKQWCLYAIERLMKAIR